MFQLLRIARAIELRGKIPVVERRRTESVGSRIQVKHSVIGAAPLCLRDGLNLQALMCILSGRFTPILAFSRKNPEG
jgi:hypothetical protein